MADPVTPTRQEIAAIVGNDERSLRAFERLFEVAGDVLPTDIIQAFTDASNAISKAQQALDYFARIADALETVATAPRQELGTLSVQNADKVDIDGGTLDDVIHTGGNLDQALVNLCTLSGGEADAMDITNGTIDGATITNGTVDSNVSDNSARLIDSSTNLSNGAGAGAGTLTNAPTAGDPTKWVSISDNGTTRYIPTWT